MVTRPVFIPEKNKIGVRVENSASFIWNPGFSLSQKQRNVDALHHAIVGANVDRRPLEVSSKSRVKLGISLSAFNLGTLYRGNFVSVESVYQASKVFAGGVGPFPDLYSASPAEVRNRIHDLGDVPIVAYKIGGEVWDLNPTRAFYDWIYCRALHKNPGLVSELDNYNCFTDIAFNPVRSLNCQAYAVALYLSLRANGVLDDALSSKSAFLKYHPIDVVNLKKTNSAENNSRTRRRKDDGHQLKFFN